MKLIKFYHQTECLNLFLLLESKFQEGNSERKTVRAQTLRMTLTSDLDSTFSIVASKGKRSWKKRHMKVDQQGTLLERKDNSNQPYQPLVPLRDGYAESAVNTKHPNSFSITTAKLEEYLMDAG